MTVDAAFTHFPSLATNLLELRQIQPSDAEAFFALYSDEQTMQFYGEPHRSVDDTRQALAQTQARFVQHEEIRWGITLTNEDQVIGSCGFHHFDTDFQRAETGYILNRAFWGQGMMIEAMSCILTYGFAALGLHRVEAIIDSANERSKSLLLKLGFTYEANLRQRSCFQGRFEDQHYFGLLTDEWHRSG